MPETLSHALRELWNPEYRHLVLHPFFVHGLVLASVFALGCTLLKQPRAAALALLMLALCAVAVFPYLQARESALQAMQAAHSKFNATEIAGLGARLRSLAWIHGVVAVLAILALIATPAKASAGMTLGLLAAAGGFALGVWGLDFHHRESRVFHPNLKEAPGAIAPAPTPIPRPAVPAPAPTPRP